MEGVGDDVIQLDVVVERDVCEPMRRREVARRRQVEELDGGGRRFEW